MFQDTAQFVHIVVYYTMCRLSIKKPFLFPLCYCVVCTTYRGFGSRWNPITINHRNPSECHVSFVRIDPAD